MNKTLIIIIFISVFVLFLLFFDRIYRYVLLKHFYNSFMWTYNYSSYLITVSGAIRKGKSTLMFGLHHLFSLKRNQVLISKMNEIESILIDLNFSYIKNNFMIYLENSDFNFDIAVNNLLNDLKINSDKYLYNLDDYLYDNMKYTSHISLLKKWLFYFYHYNKNHFVYSNIKTFNQISCTYSLQFKYNWLKLKDFKINKEFPFDEFSIFMYDEMLLESKNDNSIKKSNEDPGTDIFFRLFGQLFRENSQFICTLQNVNRMLSIDRELFQQHIYVRNSYLVNSFKVRQYIINLLERINDFIYSLISKILTKFNRTDYLDKCNIFKKINRFIIIWNKKNISKSFIKFETTIYDNLDNVGKFVSNDDENSSAYNFNFYIPTIYCWDIGDTHIFHAVYEYLHNNSLLKHKDVLISDLLYFDIEEILSKYSEKKSKSGSNINDF